MANSRDANKQLFDKVKNNIYANVRDELYSHRNQLIAGRYISAPPEPNWEALAAEAVNKRSINGVKLEDFPPLAGGKRIQDLIPTRERIDGIAEDVRAGVAENTGSIGFLHGATIGQAFKGFVAMARENGLGAAVFGMFNLMFGDGGSQNALGLKQHIGRLTAEDVGHGVKQRLEHSPELKLTAEQIDQITVQTKNAILRHAGIRPPSTVSKPGAPSAAAIHEDLGLRSAVRGQVVQSLGLEEQRMPDGTLNLVPAAGEKASEGRKNLMLLGQLASSPNGLSAGQRDVVIGTLTDAVHSAVTASPSLKDAVSIRNRIESHLQTQFDQHPAEHGFSVIPANERQQLARLMATKSTISLLSASPQKSDREAASRFTIDTDSEMKTISDQLTVGVVQRTLNQNVAPDSLVGRFLPQSTATTSVAKTLETPLVPPQTPPGAASKPAGVGK
ncbi:MAG: hypothetical protein LC104_06100 [Bacteroidales bacterium]|nr:hypothetical protein [Bacteroidales bacterium]